MRRHENLKRGRASTSERGRASGYRVRADRWVLLGRCDARQSGRSYCTQRRLTSTCGRGCPFGGPPTPTSPGSPAPPPAGRRVSCSTEIRTPSERRNQNRFQGDARGKSALGGGGFRGSDGVAAESQRKSGVGEDVSIPCFGFASYGRMFNLRKRDNVLVLDGPTGTKILHFLGIPYQSKVYPHPINLMFLLSFS